LGLCGRGTKIFPPVFFCGGGGDMSNVFVLQSKIQRFEPLTKQIF